MFTYINLQKNNSFLEEVERLHPNKEESIIVSCQIGLRGAAATVELMDAEYRRVYSLQDGFNAWLAAGLPFVE
jgi:rhodanese-related sulfurtransferase